MARHTCDNCGAVVADEEFCPSCGAWIDQLEEEPSLPQEDEYEEFALQDEPEQEVWEQPRVVVPRQEVICPSCGSANPATNRHCEECGARLSQGALPVAPRPAVQATAGVRAVMAISGLLLGVVVVALIFNLVSRGGGSGTTPSTTVAASTTSTSAAKPEAIDILSVECTPQGLSGYRCDNLINGTDGEWQVNWQKLPAGENPTIKLIFAQPMIIREIIWENLADGDRFYQNYRAKRLLAEVQGEPAFPLPLEDTPGKQTLAYASMRALDLTLEVTDAYPAQERNNKIFTELAVKGITVVGIPAPTTGETTTTGG